MRTLSQPRRPFPLGRFVHLMRADDVHSKRFQSRLGWSFVGVLAVFVLLHVGAQVVGLPSVFVMIFGRV